MSKVRADRYTNRADDGAPTFSQGVNVVGSGISIGIGASVYSPSTNELVLGTNSTERVRIANDGNVGIGTDNPLRQLQLHSDAGETVALQLTNGGTGATNDNSGFTLKIGSVGQVNLDQRTPGQDIIVFTNAVERMRVGSVGVCTFVKDVHISDGNLVVANGKGIDFSATGDGSGTVSAEVLDEYEEGTVTLAFESSGATFSMNPSYTTGVYTRVGNLCQVTAYIGTNATPTGTLTNAVNITGLPFSTLSNGSYMVSAAVGSIYEWNAPANTLQMRLSGDTGHPRLNISWNIDNGVSVSATANQMGSSTYLSFTVVYQVA